MDLGMVGVVLATIGGGLLATQIPSDAVMFPDRSKSDITLDSGPSVMKRYRQKLFLYRLGLLLLVVGGAIQAHAS
jgi:hypothetical protein